MISRLIRLPPRGTPTTVASGHNRRACAVGIAPNAEPTCDVGRGCDDPTSRLGAADEEQVHLSRTLGILEPRHLNIELVAIHQEDPL